MKTVKFFYALPFFCCFCFNSVSASFILNDQCCAALENNRSLKFKTSESMAKAELIKNPSNSIPLFIIVESYFIKALLNEDPADITQFQKSVPALQKKMEDQDSHFLREYFLGRLDFYSAVLLFKQNKFLPAALTLKSAYHRFEEAYAQYKSPIFLAELGVLHSIFSTIPDEFSWMFSLAGIHGSFFKGRNELIDAYRFSTKNSDFFWLSTDILLYFSYLELTLNPDEQSGKNLKSLIINQFQSRKDSPLLIFLLAEVYLKSNQSGMALNALKKYSQGTHFFKWYYLDYMQGLCYLHKLDAQNASYYFKNFLFNYKGKSFVKAAYQKWQWCEWLLGNNEKAAQLNSKILLLGGKETDPDKSAFFEATQNKPINIPLLKARLLFDGGYFEQALAMLKEDSISNKLKTIEDSTEFYYRLGRIYNGMNQTKDALENYDKAIWYGSSLTSYFAANACLLSGEIYEKQKDYAKAKIYYRRVLTFENKQYKRSMQQKAKAGLHRLSQ